MSFLNEADPSVSPFGGADFGYDPTSIEFDAGALAGLALGAKIGGNLRGEIEFAYRRNDVSSYFEGTGSTPADTSSSGDVSEAFTLMANVFHDIEVSENVGVHIGGGVGVARLSIDMANVDYSDIPVTSLDDDQWVLAGQLGAGFSWLLGNNTTLFLDYRLLVTQEPEFEDTHSNGPSFDFSHEYISHSVMAGIRIPIGQ